MILDPNATASTKAWTWGLRREAAQNAYKTLPADCPLEKRADAWQKLLLLREINSAYIAVAEWEREARKWRRGFYFSTGGYFLIVLAAFLATVSQ